LRRWLREACLTSCGDEAGDLPQARDFASRDLYWIYEITLFEPIRFLWNATRGSRLRPWRSEYLRWRIETYSGLWAEKLTLREMVAFVWTSRWELARFLAWTGDVKREALRRP
jgi:hypothetical protein